MITYHPNHSHLSSSLSTTQSDADTMTHDEEAETDQNPMSDQILEWLGGSLPYMPSIFDDPYGTNDFDADSLWILGQNPDHEQNNNNNSTTTSATSTALVVVEPVTLQPSDSCKKRKASTDVVVITPKTSRKSQVDDGEALVEQTVPARRTVGRRNYAGGKTAAANCNNGGNNKEGRWAEQLLNPCAAAITASNPSRVQHLLYVINELASLTGDANHRLAAHGLRALTHHLSSPGSSASSTGGTTFASTNPKFFTVSLLNFNDVNPWFRIPNSIANSSILQIHSEQNRPKNLHIVDIGVSHGIQWPTLLEELSRQSGGPPPLVRITVLTQTIEDEQSRNTPFAVSPPGYNCSSQLLSFAKAININLQINKLDNFPLQNLNSRVINSTPDETLIICTQFRVHNLKHNNPDDRTQFLRVLKSMQPSGVILSENNADCSCNNCVDFATGFSTSVEYLWRFLDSTSVAYKGRESDERRMMEGEAAKALTNVGEMNERKEKWCERMMSVGFTKKVFGDDAIDGARALLRKYDNNWEVRVEDKDGCIGLWWKGQPISFCSLWKPEPGSAGIFESAIKNGSHDSVGYGLRYASTRSVVSKITGSIS